MRLSSKDRREAKGADNRAPVSTALPLFRSQRSAWASELNPATNSVERHALEGSNIYTHTYILVSIEGLTVGVMLNVCIIGTVLG